jgi:hypothetical protein
MNINRIVHATAGTLVLTSLALAHWHNPYWIWLAAFVGTGLLVSGVTNRCVLACAITRICEAGSGARDRES